MPHADADSRSGTRHWLARLGKGRALLSVLGVMTLAVVLVLLLLALSIWQSHRDAAASAEGRATNAVFVGAAYVGWLIEANLQAVARIAETVGARPGLLDGPRADDLAAAVSTLPGDVQISVYDAAGDAILASGPFAPAHVAERHYFQQVRDGDRWSIGALQRADGVDRRHFAVAHRIERDGGFAGAVISFVPNDLLSTFWRSMDLGPNATVGLIRNDGWLLAREPPLDEPLNLAGHVLFTDHLRQGPEGLYRSEVSPADGVSRLVAFRRIDRLPLVLTVGVAADTLAASFLRRAGAQLLLLSPVALALLAVSAWAVVLVRREETALEARDAALERNRLLFREIHHRVKNNLQTVASLVRMQDGLGPAKDALSGRIAAMAAVHEHIFDQRQFDRLDFAAYLRTLCDRLHAIHGERASIECRAAAMTVAAAQAMPLGLIVNELVTNAFKHAFADGRSGRIVVSLERLDDGTARLTVEDDGIGAAADRPTGLGSQLIAALTRQIGGRIALETTDGTRFALTFPVPGDNDAPSPPAVTRQAA